MDKKFIKANKENKKKETKMSCNKEKKERIFREEAKLPPSMRYTLYRII